MKKRIQIKAAARSSPLSKKQVQEVLRELLTHHPDIELLTTYVETIGDKDRSTSLRTLDKTDFFTKEIDLLVMQGRVQIGIHSAKDLPDPLPAGLVVMALTKGLTSADALVLRPGCTLAALPGGARIATSSVRREDMVKSLRSDVCFIDIRGTIEERLAKLSGGEAEGVVIAEAALLRLGLQHLNRVLLPGETVPGQGQLAVVGRAHDEEIIEIFACMDSRKTNEKGIVHRP